MFNPSHITQAAHTRALKEGKWGSNIHVFPCIGFQQSSGSTGELFWTKKHEPRFTQRTQWPSSAPKSTTYVAFILTSFHSNSLRDKSTKVPAFLPRGLHSYGKNRCLASLRKSARPRAQSQEGFVQRRWKGKWHSSLPSLGFTCSTLFVIQKSIHIFHPVLKSCILDSLFPVWSL